MNQASLMIDVRNTGKQVSLCWLNVNDLVSHPRNPRIGRPDKLDSIIESMRVDGYRPEKPMLVRPYETGYQIIGGHSRHTAAKAVGLEQVFCAVEEMDDDTAIIRIGEDNLNDPLPWYSVCLYVVQNSVKDSKKGLSRTQLIRAATGKDGQAAKQEAMRKGEAGEVLLRLIEKQSTSVGTLLDPDTNRTLHLVEINSAPEETQELITSLVLENTWSAKDTKAAVDRIRSVADLVPTWLPDVSSVYPKVAMEPGYAKSTAAALKTAVDLYNKLPITAEQYQQKLTDEVKVIDGREHHKWISEPYTINPREWFIAQISRVSGEVIPSIQNLENVYRNIISDLQGSLTKTETWLPVRSEQEEREYQNHLVEMARISDREEFTPKIINGDAIDKLRTLSSNSFDLVCVDPPYNMDKADWDSYGNGKAFAEWAKPWLIECKRVLKDSGSIYLFGINRMLSHIQHVLDEIGMEYRNWIVWDTIQGAGGGLWVNRHESILYYSKTRETYEDSDSVKLERHEENIREYKGREYFFKNPSNVWRFPCVDDKHQERTEHPTQKPVELIERIILASSPKGGRVLDCFMGSGTTGVACMKHRRYCVGIEMNSDYISIAQSRFAETEVCK